MIEALEMVSSRYGHTQASMRSRLQDDETSEARDMFCLLATRKLRKGASEIGRFLFRHHTTVAYMLDRAKRRMEEDADFAETYEFLAEYIGKTAKVKKDPWAKAMNGQRFEDFQNLRT